VPLSALCLAFASAIVHALWNVMLKRTKDLDASSAGVFTVSMALSAVASVFVPGQAFPAAPAFLWGVAAGLCEGGYFVGLVRSLEEAPLGWSYGWMRGSSIILVWPVSVLCLGEPFRGVSLVSIALVCLGLGLLGAASGRGGSSRALGWALLAGVCIAAFNVFYKLSLSAGAQPLALFSLSMAVGLPIQASVRILRSGWKQFRWRPESPGLVVLAGVLCAVGFMMFLLALAKAGTGAVTTIRNTSVVFAMLFSLALGERPRPRQWLGAALVTLGAAGLGWR
jgi:drug/metabolite transporter (DMT)-like permease